MSHAISVPRVIWNRLNSLWVVFFLCAGLLNLYVANLFFIDEAALRAATGIAEVDFSQCDTLFSGHNLELCRAAQSAEEDWVNFKLFGLMGLTLAFVIAQAFFLARHVRDEEAAPETESAPASKP